MSEFKFKNFSVKQDQCAMKIGTDAVLLGAWASLNNNPFSVLDIGAGTGILSLMLAQRSRAELIDAIEIDDAAYEQCVENFESSPWGDRLFCYHAGLDEFVEEIDDQYDLIISNPPFYSENYKTEDQARDLARFTDALPFQELLAGVSKLLSEDGQFCVIIPFKEEARFISLAAELNLYPRNILQVKGQPSSDFKRSLLTFSFEPATVETNALVIETTRHNYTDAYIELTKDFYLKM